MIPHQHRLVRLAVDGDPRWAEVAEDGRIYELTGSPFTSWGRGAEIGFWEDLPFLAPAEPTKIVCVGLNYADHAAEVGKALPTEPLLFLKPPSSVVGPEQPILMPAQSERVDYEAELAVVVGRRCRDVTVERAWGYVLGVTNGNDVTARDLQRSDGQWTRAKGFDTFCPLGPWLVTGVEEEDIADLPVLCRVNGQVRQSSRTRELIFSPAQLVAFASSVMTLEPGDVILTGTPSGIGPLVDGDVVEVEVEGLGVLRNPVSASSGSPGGC